MLAWTQAFWSAPFWFIHVETKTFSSSKMASGCKLYGWEAPTLPNKAAVLSIQLWFFAVSFPLRFQSSIYGVNSEFSLLSLIICGGGALSLLATGTWLASGEKDGGNAFQLQNSFCCCLSHSSFGVAYSGPREVRLWMFYGCIKPSLNTLYMFFRQTRTFQHFSFLFKMSKVKLS